MKRLVILGAGGHGKVVAELAVQLGRWDDVVFLDDRAPELTEVLGFPVAGKCSPELVSAEDDVHVAIGSATARLGLLDAVVAQGVSIPALVHPHAMVSPSAKIGDGSVCMAGSIVQADVRVGVGCIINSGATVDHDCQLGDGVHVAPGVNVSGGVHIGRASWLGTGVSVKQGIRIGEGVMIGVGAAVIDDIASGSTAYGVPAKVKSRG